MASNKTIGDLAEAAEITRLRGAGFWEEIYILQNAQGHGVDIVAIGPGRVDCIEVKANSSRLSKEQRRGGPEYLADRLTAAINGSLLNKPGRGWQGIGKVWKRGSEHHHPMALSKMAAQLRDRLDERGGPYLTQGQIDDILAAHRAGRQPERPAARPQGVAFRYLVVRYQVDAHTKTAVRLDETSWEQPDDKAAGD